MSATTYFSFTEPAIGNTSTWGLTTNQNWSTLDSALYAANGGLTTGVNSESSASSITLTNPLASTQEIAFTASSQSLILPAMNATFSPVIGGVITVVNTGSYAFEIFAQDGSTVVLTSLPAGATAKITVTSISTANGTFNTVVQGDLFSGNNLSDVANTATSLTNLGGTTLAAALAAVYPVGSLYFNANVATNPATLLGFGTWTAFGAGRIPIGVGTGTDINGATLTVAAGATGGEYQHTQTISELVSHPHTDEGHKHQGQDQNGSSIANIIVTGSGGLMVGGGSGYGEFGETATGTANIQNTGGGDPFNVTNPYIGVYIWLRAA